MFKLGLMLLSISLSCTALAGVTCEEKVDKVRVHSNGGIYIFTEKACSGRCLLQWDSEDKKESGLAALLAARAAEKAVTMHWPDLTSCDDVNVMDASPNFIDF